MKLFIEIIVSLLLHPLAFILALVNLAGRRDLSRGKKVIWGVVCVLWGIGPILYVTVGDGALW